MHEELLTSLSRNRRKSERQEGEEASSAGCVQQLCLDRLKAVDDVFERMQNQFADTRITELDPPLTLYGHVPPEREAFLLFSRAARLVVRDGSPGQRSVAKMPP